MSIGRIVVAAAFIAVAAGVAPADPDAPVGHRAALLVQADEPNKTKTFVGSVTWTLDVPGAWGADPVVEARVDVPDGKTRAVISFRKNEDANGPASHLIKVRFIVAPGNVLGGVKQVAVPQMRDEGSPTGQPLAGTMVRVMPNVFLVGLYAGKKETANLDLMRRLPWFDIPMLLDSGKIAKLTFEKGEAGTRDLNQAFEAWQR